MRAEVLYFMDGALFAKSRPFTKLALLNNFSKLFANFGTVKFV